MKKHIIYLLFISIFTQCKDEMGPDCVSATEYVMQFLGKSSTLFRGSKTWIDNLKNKNSCVDTVYAKTWNHEYNGVAAFGLSITPEQYKTYETMLTAYFKTKHNENDTITIHSSITDSEVVKALSEIEAHEMQKNAFLNHGKEEILNDTHSKCSIQHLIDYNEQTKRSKITTKYNCETTLQVVEFLNTMKKLKNN